MKYQNEISPLSDQQVLKVFGVKLKFNLNSIGALLFEAFASLLSITIDYQD